jgi:general secretion pathway protein C
MTSALARFELTPYRQRIALALLTGAVVISLAFALAGLTWRLAGHAGTGAITVPPTARPVPVPDIAPALALAPFGRTAPGDAAQATTLALQLRGLVYAQPQSLAAAFISANGETAKPYRVGDAVLSASIESIEPRRVLLRNGGRVEFLAFPDPFATPGAAPTLVAGAPNPNAPPSQAAPSPPPPPVQANVPSPADVMARFDARPVSGGYQVGDNAPVGLRPGDVLRSVNGGALTSPEAARDALTRAQQAGTAQVQITRDGKPVTLTVPIR